MIISTNNYDLLQPMYPLLIQQFVDDYHLKQGIALDIGVGPGWLGLELSKITDMEIVFFDIS
ncbi:MAG: class I SAM-dependent methyltransferase, partial [Spirochaetia bacterium]|nr:class I SAM-dependent methyltransferase [Spirochaetia bacterium]